MEDVFAARFRRSWRHRSVDWTIDPDDVLHRNGRSVARLTDVEWGRHGRNRRQVHLSIRTPEATTVIQCRRRAGAERESADRLVREIVRRIAANGTAPYFNGFGSAREWYGELVGRVLVRAFYFFAPLVMVVIILANGEVNAFRIAVCLMLALALLVQIRSFFASTRTANIDDFRWPPSPSNALLGRRPPVEPLQLLAQIDDTTIIAMPVRRRSD